MAKKKRKPGVITLEDLRRINRGARREAEIEQGILKPGSGYHGGGKRTKNRSDRRDAKLKLDRREW